MTLQQLHKRLGGSAVGGMLAYAMMSDGASPYGGGGVPPSAAFTANNGLLSPGHSFAQIASRHMHLYGTKREHFAEVCISERENAIKRPTVVAHRTADARRLLQRPDDHRPAVPVRLHDGERRRGRGDHHARPSGRRDLRQPPVLISAADHGGAGRWGPALFRYFQTPDEDFASSGHRPVAKRMYEMAGIGPEDVDVALLYDHFSPMVIMQLEDYGFCPIGEGGPFVADGNIRYGTGSIPVNTHGGNLSEAYIIGMTHVREAVEQLRGTAVNQVDGAEVALVTGGPAGLPVSGATPEEGCMTHEPETFGAAQQGACSPRS